MRFAETAEPQFKGLEPAAWLERLERELGNLRMVLDWALENGAVDSGLRLAGALHHFWRRHGRLSEGRRYLERLLALTTVVDRDGDASQVESDFVTPVPVAVRAKALFSMAALMLWQSDRSGLAPLEQSIEALAMMLNGQRKAERAAATSSRAARLREVIGEPVRPTLQPDMDRTLAAVHATLGDGAFASAWAEGQTLPLEQVFT